MLGRLSVNSLLRSGFISMTKGPANTLRRKQKESSTTIRPSPSDPVHQTLFITPSPSDPVLPDDRFYYFPSTLQQPNKIKLDIKPHHVTRSPEQRPLQFGSHWWQSRKEARGYRDRAKSTRSLMRESLRNLIGWSEYYNGFMKRCWSSGYVNR